MATKRPLRGRARGAALVEAAVAIPFFIVIFMALVFFSKLYIEKQRTMAEARQKVWTYAMANCKGDSSNIQNSQESVGAGSGNDLGDNSKYAGGFKGSDTSSKGSSTASTTSKGSVTTKERQNTDDQTSGYTTVTKNITSKATVTCNEEPVDGDDIGGAIKKAWGLIVGG